METKDLTPDDLYRAIMEVWARKAKEQLGTPRPDSGKDADVEKERAA